MKMVLMVICRMCKSSHDVTVDDLDYDKWKDGKLIQDVMPYLSKSDRELLISKTCNDCWNKLFNYDEEDEDE